MSAPAASARVPAPGRRHWRLVALLAAVALLQVASPLGYFLYATAITCALLALGWVFASVAVADTTALRKVEPSTVEAGGWADVDLTVGNAKRVAAPWLFWEEQLDPRLGDQSPACGLATFAAGEERRLPYSVRLPARGLYRIGPTLLEGCDPLGIVRRFRLLGGAHFVTARPRRVSLEHAWPLGRSPVHEHPRRNSFMEDPSRFVGVREFQLGDGMRRVHWRATARVGRLQSRRYEPAVLGGALLAVEQDVRAYPGLGVDGRQLATGERIAAEHDPRVELAVTTAASLAEYVLGGGQAVGLLSNGADAAERFPTDWQGSTFRRLDEALGRAARTRRVTRKGPFEVEPGKGSRHRDLLLQALARLVPSKARPLPELLVDELPRLPRHLVVIVITPRLDPELGVAVASLRRAGLDVTVAWLRRPGRPASDAAHLAATVPVHVVGDESELARLGDRRL